MHTSTKLSLLAAVFASTVAVSPVGAELVASGQNANGYATAAAYVEEFYPLWFSFYQTNGWSNANRLLGPDRISPIYQVVVAINDDTLYCSSFLNLKPQPVILTIPATTASYSILTLDPYGDTYQLITPPPAGVSAVYALTAPGFAGTLPAGVTPIAMPFTHMALIFRVDKYSSTNQNQIKLAEMFRASLELQTQSDYVSNPSGGAAQIVPETAFWTPYKTIADAMIASDPINFLKLLQAAVVSPATPPLSTRQKELSDKFNALIDSGTAAAALAAGAQAAHNSILSTYLTHTGLTNWITFTNIGEWGDRVIERSSIAEFIQYANNYSASAYYQTFVDKAANPLDGRNGYVLTFPDGGPPAAKRFWSITAYTPESVELIRNSANKYEVASYMNPQPNADGSLSVYMTQQQPPGVPAANWLPVSSGPFNIMLRFYGPQGTVAAGTYVPPGVSPIR